MIAMNMPADEVPRQWRGAFTLAKFAGTILASAGTALGVVHVEASRVVDAKWNERQRAEVLSIASEAARQGAALAIAEQFRSFIAPLSERVTAHVAADDDRVDALRQRVQDLEQRFNSHYEQDRIEFRRRPAPPRQVPP